MKQENPLAHPITRLKMARAERYPRRQFVKTLGALAGSAALLTAAWPFAVHAQQTALPVIGFLNGASPGLYERQVRAFHQGLAESGFVERQNCAIEYRWAEGHYDRLPAMAADLVARRVSVIVAGGHSAAVAAKAATTKIPVVFVSGSDPVNGGLVASLNRPGGNLTGVVLLAAELGPKRLELIHELLPAAKLVAFLVNPTNLNGEAQTKAVEAAAGTLGLQLHVLHASTERELDTAFTNLAQVRTGALVIGTDIFFISQSARIAGLTLKHSIPAIYQFREFTAAGGLMSYGGSLTDTYHHVGAYSGRILKGAQPSDLPIQQETKIELIINLKTAKAFGLNVPITLLGRADEVIE